MPGIDWKIEVDKAEAAKYGAGVNTVGSAIQLVTNGLKATEYRPVDSDKSVDILVRFPPDRRSLDQIDDLRIQTQVGHVPIGNFVKRVPAQRVGYINRVNGSRVMTVTANIAEGVQAAKVQQEITAELARADLGPGVIFKLKGEDEEREKAGAFLMKAFGTAIFLIFAILLAQFNKLTSVGLVLTAVILSTFGVLLGLLIMGQPFGVVMTGIGVIANAGVIVNNNIVLIDTYDRLRREGVEAYEAILETCRERARPVVLTAVTAILGVLPIAFGMNIEFMSREITIGAPATQWWINLSTAIVFGLGFATVLTLIVTPAALMGIELMRQKRLRFVAAWRARFARPVPLLRRNTGVLDHLRPSLDLSRNERGEFVRRTGQRRDGERVHPILDVRAVDVGRQDFVELVDDRTRRARRRHHREPAGGAIALHAAFGDRRQVRHGLDAAGRGDAERLHLALLDGRDRDREVDDHERDLTGDHVRQCCDAAAVGDMLRLSAGHLQEHLHEQVVRRRCARRGKAHLPVPALDQRDQVLHGIDSEPGIDDERELRRADEADRREILHGVVWQRLVDTRPDRQRRHRRNEDRMPASGAARAAACAATMVPAPGRFSHDRPLAHNVSHSR